MQTLQSAIERLLESPDLIVDSLEEETIQAIQNLQEQMRDAFDLSAMMDSLEAGSYDLVDCQGDGGELDPSISVGTGIVHPETGSLLVRVDDAENQSWMSFTLQQRKEGQDPWKLPEPKGSNDKKPSEAKKTSSIDKAKKQKFLLTQFIYRHRTYIVSALTWDEAMHKLNAVAPIHADIETFRETDDIKPASEAKRQEYFGGIAFVDSVDGLEFHH